MKILWTTRQVSKFHVEYCLPQKFVDTFTVLFSVARATMECCVLYCACVHQCSPACLGRLLTVAQMVEQLVAAVSAFCDFWSELGAGNVIAFGWKLDTSLFATQSGALLSSIVTTDICSFFVPFSQVYRALILRHHMC